MPPPYQEVKGELLTFVTGSGPWYAELYRNTIVYSFLLGGVAKKKLAFGADI